MPPHTTTNTLLEAQDFLTQLDYRDQPLANLPREQPARRPAPTPHDFLVLSLRPDLTPDLPAAAEQYEATHSWERNIPQK